jgi:hypothetical protein
MCRVDAGAVVRRTPTGLLSNVAVCVPTVPRRMNPVSAATPWWPISMLLFPVVRLYPADAPIAILPPPVVLLKSAFTPIAVFGVPVVL